MNKNLKYAFALGLASTSLAGCERVRDNQAAIVTDYGRVSDIVNEPSEKGLIWTLTPGKEVIVYTLRNQEVSATTDQETSSGKNRLVIRTNDGYQVEGTVLVKFNVIANDKDKFSKLYNELTSTTEGNNLDNKADGYQDDLQRVVLIAASTAMEKFKGADLSGKSLEIGTEIQKELQAIVDKNKWPFQITGIAPNMGLTKAANSLFEQNAQLDARNQLAVKRQTVAAQEAEATKAEVAATANIFKGFKEAGASEEAATTLTCFELKRTGKEVSGPCTPNTAIGLPAPK